MSADLPAPTWDAVRPVRRGHRWAIAGGVTLLPGLVAVVLRVVPPTDDATALVASFIPYGLLVTVVALGCFLLAAAARRSPARPDRGRTGGRAAGAPAVLAGARLRARRAPGHHPPFTLMSLNLYNGEADPARSGRTRSRPTW